MEIKPCILENGPLTNTCSWSTSSMHPNPIQYFITKRNPLNLRFMAVILTTLSWVIMLVVCNHPEWVTLEQSKRKLWTNESLTFALWDHCAAPSCLTPNKLLVYLLVSRGIMFLNLIFTALLIISMMCSFRRIFSRISKLDFAFSIANYIAGLALLLCNTMFGLQVLEIFSEKGETFYVKWPFYLSGFAVLSFIMAGTICLNSHKTSWNISYLSPNALPTQLKKQRLWGSLFQQSSTSVILQEVTTSSTDITQEETIPSVLKSNA
ncbi:transmembrane protein 225B-like [Notamacropus eugenii]|uniref:transmembrane protein 225B-like n=1 Tax=Notamacropus eugenii TaxID=9315 RepID=UPI003B67EA30